MEQLSYQINEPSITSYDVNIIKCTSIEKTESLFDQLTPEKINFIYLGMQNYMESWDLQKRFMKKIKI